MDLLFKRYASPFLLVNQMMQTKQFTDFVDTLLEFANEEKLWEFYLHKVEGISFEEYKNSVFFGELTSTNIETTVNESYDILQDFVPK